jgi:serine/threonine protein kinase
MEPHVDDDRTRIAIRGSAVSIGTELNQTYRIDSLLGVGGMGEVFRGHNIQTGDPVAIKVVLPEYAQDETILGLFRKEARILNHLNHEAIVRYYVFSIDSVLSRPYLAMEFVDGPSLAAHVKNAPLTAPEFMPLLRRLADGLHRAHGAGVIHRDMSPDNVILPGGLVQNAKIIDFGIARSANVGGETLLGGSFAGKYSFVSPEQLGLYGGEVTPKSDIYSLALVMAAAMRGRPLEMSGSQVDVLEKRRSVPDLSAIPKQFHPVLSAMLTPDPAKRPADMAAIRDWPDSQSSPRPKAEKPRAVASNLVQAKPPQPSNALRNGILATAIVAVIAIGSLGGWIYSQRDMLSSGSQALRPTQASDKPPQTPVPDGDSHASKTQPSTPAQAGDKPAETTLPVTPSLDKQASKAQPSSPPQTDDKSPQITGLAVPGGDNRVAKVEPPTADTSPKAGKQGSLNGVTLPKPPAGPTGQQAAVPSILPPPDLRPSTASLRDFVTSFGADNCFAATADNLTATSATFTALGTSQASQNFTDGFKQRAGFAPAVTLEPVSDQQCEFVNSLPRMSVPGAPPLNLAVSASEIRGGNAEKGTLGDPLTVSVTGAGERNIYLFVMDHKGGIQNINRLCASCITMKTGEMEAGLSLSVPARIDGESRPPFYPMLVFAVASSRPLISINSQDAFEANDFIAPFLKEIANARDVTTATGFVKLHDQ